LALTACAVVAGVFVEPFASGGNRLFSAYVSGAARDDTFGWFWATVFTEPASEHAGRASIDGSLDLICPISASNDSQIAASVAITAAEQAVLILAFEKRNKSIRRVHDLPEESAMAKDAAHPSVSASILKD